MILHLYSEFRSRLDKADLAVAVAMATAAGGVCRCSSRPGLIQAGKVPRGTLPRATPRLRITAAESETVTFLDVVSTLLNNGAAAPKRENYTFTATKQAEMKNSFKIQLYMHEL